jgi:hypothetical protein
MTHEENKIVLQGDGTYNNPFIYDYHTNIEKRKKLNGAAKFNGYIEKPRKYPNNIEEKNSKGKYETIYYSQIEFYNGETSYWGYRSWDDIMRELRTLKYLGYPLDRNIAQALLDINEDLADQLLNEFYNTIWNQITPNLICHIIQSTT